MAIAQNGMVMNRTSQILGITLGYLSLFCGSSLALEPPAIEPEPSALALPDLHSEIPLAEPVTPVQQLSDVQPTDWAFQALQSLIERYGLPAGYLDASFRGNQPLSRDQFAAVLSPLLGQLRQQIQADTAAIADPQLAILQRLQTDFAPELNRISERLDRLETRSAQLQSQQFSPTTRLSGQVIVAANAGGFGGDRLLAPRGAVVSDQDPNATLIYRASLNLNTSFNGTDLLQVRLLSGSTGIDDNAAGFLDPNLGSTLDFSIPGRSDRLSLARLYYSFEPVEDLTLTLGSLITAPDVVDKNRYANASFRDFSTQALVNTFILFPRARGAGAAIDWHPKAWPVSLRAVYLAGDADNALPENQLLFGGGRPNDIRLFPAGGGGAEGGLFGDPYQGIVELEYSPSRAFALRLQYGAGRLFGGEFDVLGLNGELALGDRLGLFGRYGNGIYRNTTLGTLRPQSWMAGLSLADLGREGAIAGVALGQPFLESAVGDGTQTNFELFYNFPINDQIRVTPLLQVVTQSGNQSENGTIFSGTLRTVISF